jgi:hypothetical protein
VEKTFAITEFKGLNDYGNSQDGTHTRSLNGVELRYGRIVGAKGMNKLSGISTVASSTIIRLMPFYTSALAGTLYRMLPTAVEQLIGSSWTDVTGSALAASTTLIPQWVVHKDTLAFVDGGADLPRKLTGSGNSATLGGSPPYAKGIGAGWGFLFLLNISYDNITYYPRRAQYSDQFDTDWSLCNGNELNFNETNGELITAWSLSDVMVFAKSDDLVQIGFSTEKVRFTQRRMDTPVGLGADKSGAHLQGIGIVFLGTDYRLHATDGYKVTPLPPNVQKKLDDTLYKARARYAVGLNFPDKDTYSLFYCSSASDTWNRNRISFNYRTGDFSHKTYANHTFTDAVAYRVDRNSSYSLVGSTSTGYVEELDTLQETEDGTVLDRYYDFDWFDCQYAGEKYLKGVTLEAVRNAANRISISVAADNRPNFVFEKSYSLRGLSPLDDIVKVHYRIDPGLRGYRFKVRVKLHHDDGSVVEIVPPALIHYEPVDKSMVQDGGSSPAISRGQ